MGYVYTDVDVSNFRDESETLSMKFLVDTGAYDTFVPTSKLESIGVERKRRIDYELADGSSVTYDTGFATVKVYGKEAVVRVVFANEDVEPLLGVLALQTIGFAVDPVDHSIKEAKFRA